MDNEQPLKTGLELRNPIPLLLQDLVPRPEFFAHPSRIHGQAHVARVMIHTFLLADALNLSGRAVKAWAAVYIHDIGRIHDGLCQEHGRYALDRLTRLPQVGDILARGGVAAEDWESITAAVTYHCMDDIPATHPHWEMTALLKDADGLDRVRLGDLDPCFLRFEPSRALVPFAYALYEETQGNIAPGPDYFEVLWPIAQRLIGRLSLL
ncbi:MAG: hypothetical protein BWY09_01699 [Candidatus Hydrogenedentes bacterium ADurb.Bin179]|nr:MAG: hypothetical protein BWY09_01699 [Candidatus Hydrogenedentes bacterium ADurb.Bin179]